MFALKLPSQIKAGAAETLHSEKKARGELTEIVDPTAHLAWKRNKGGPVWGTKGDAEGQQANPTPLSPGVGPGDKVGTPGWGVKTVLPVVSVDPELKVRRLCDRRVVLHVLCGGVNTERAFSQLHGVFAGCTQQAMGPSDCMQARRIASVCICIHAHIFNRADASVCCCMYPWTMLKLK